MGNLSQKEMEEIESSLVSFDSNIQANLKQEYYTLKDKLLLNQTHLKKQSNDLLLTSPLKKLLVNPINISKRLERIGKWVKMIFPSKVPLTPSKESNSSSNNSSFRSNSENDHRSNNSNRYSTTSSFKKKNVVLKIASPHRQKSISVDLNGFNANYTNQVSVIESNLRKYYHDNKEHFKERTAKGPPDSLRWMSWLIISNVPVIRTYRVYLKYLLDDIDDNVDMQICKDLNRTASEYNTNEANFIIGSGNYEDMLYRILRAYSNADKKLGYCQGMNFITGFLLAVSNNNEIETFYMLVALLNNGWNIRGLFLEEFPLLNYYIDIFDLIMERECSDVRNHILKLDMPNEVWISKWLQTLYTMSLPYDINLRIWDYMLTNGIEFIISFSITLIITLEKEIKAFDDAYDLLEFCKAFFSSTLNHNNNNSSGMSNNNNNMSNTKEDNKDLNAEPNNNNNNSNRNGLNEIYSTDACLKEKRMIQINNILKQSEKLHRSIINKDLLHTIKKAFISKKESNALIFQCYKIEMNPLNEKFLIANTFNTSNTNRTNFKSELSEEENVPFCYRDDLSNEEPINKVNSNHTPISKQFTEHIILFNRPKV